MTVWQNKVVLITGAARGMGAAHVRKFVETGAKVVFTDVLEEEGRALQQELEGKAIFLKLDVSDAAQWQRVVEETETLFGPIHILVNNAGISIKGSILDLTEQQYRKVLDVNQLGVFHGMQAVVPSMKKVQDGAIINISSILGIAARADSLAYVSTKFAIRGMTKVAALEFAADGIRVNSVHPGSIKTALTPTVYPTEEAMQERERAIPLQRFGKVEDVADLVAFLASNEASYITGSEFVIDGGVLARI